MKSFLLFVDTPARVTATASAAVIATPTAVATPVYHLFLVFLMLLLQYAIGTCKVADDNDVSYVCVGAV